MAPGHVAARGIVRVLGGSSQRARVKARQAGRAKAGPGEGGPQGLPHQDVTSQGVMSQIMFDAESASIRARQARNEVLRQQAAMVFD